MSEGTAPRTSPAALASFVLGLASLALLALAGLPALYLGLRGVRAVNESGGRLRGLRLAVAGMALGAVTSAATLVGFAALVVVHLAVRSYQVECVNNLRRLGLAVHGHSDLHADAPPAGRGAPFPRGTVPNADLPPERRLGWLAEVLPFLVEKGPYQSLPGKVDLRRGWEAPANAGALNTPVRYFLCPAHPHFDPAARPGLTHYVGLAGVDPDAARLPTGHPRAGVFGYDRVVRLTDVTAGLSYTVMVAETARDNGPWLAGGPPTVRGVPPDEERYLGPGRPFGGMHPRGANLLWADASVRWVADTVPAENFRAQSTLAGKE
jgi:prepilin-type processing-associated H-X9-DG protein